MITQRIFDTSNHRGLICDATRQKDISETKNNEKANYTLTAGRCKLKNAHTAARKVHYNVEIKSTS